MKLQGESGSYIDDSAIAADIAIPLEEVRGHLELLAAQDRLRLSRTSKGHSGYLSAGQKQLVKEQSMSNESRRSEVWVDPTKVFVVHGRNRAARDALFTFLRAIGLHPLEWSEIVRETGDASPYIGQVLETGFSLAQAIVVLMTPDDEVRLRVTVKRIFSATSTGVAAN